MVLNSAPEKEFEPRAEEFILSLSCFSLQKHTCHMEQLNSPCSAPDYWSAPPRRQCTRRTHRKARRRPPVLAYTASHQCLPPITSTTTLHLVQHVQVQRYVYKWPRLFSASGYSDFDLGDQLSFGQLSNGLCVTSMTLSPPHGNCICSAPWPHCLFCQ